MGWQGGQQTTRHERDGPNPPGAGAGPGGVATPQPPGQRFWGLQGSALARQPQLLWKQHAPALLPSSHDSRVFKRRSGASAAAVLRPKQPKPCGRAHGGWVGRHRLAVQGVFAKLPAAPVLSGEKAVCFGASE